MKQTETFYAESQRLQDWLIGRGCQPIGQKGKALLFTYSKDFQTLLDEYYIETVIFKVY